MLQQSLKDSPLGKDIPYLTDYNSSLLFAIPRRQTRETMGIFSPLPFEGVDIWNAFEISWLNSKGKPIVAIGEIYCPCTSPMLLESKALKTYMHSFNQTHFDTLSEVEALMQKDISAICQAPVTIKIKLPQAFTKTPLQSFEGICLDDLDIETNAYTIDSSLLKVENDVVEEKLFSNLLKSNCLVTGQPDWGHVFIHYKGKKINHASLLKYIISFRNHNGFHEQCIERMFIDIMQVCHPEKLTVYGRYTRRGGLDINPFRSNWEKTPTTNPRLFRQ